MSRTPISARSVRGLSLIELMIAITLGMLIVAAIGTFACALGWRAKPHGYGD